MKTIKCNAWQIIANKDIKTEVTLSNRPRAHEYSAQFLTELRLVENRLHDDIAAMPLAIDAIWASFRIPHLVTHDVQKYKHEESSTIIKISAAAYY